MVYLLSIGFTLIVLALGLKFLWRAMRKGKEANLLSSGLWIAGLGVVVAIVGITARWTHWLSSQEGDVLANTAIAIVVTGGIPALQGIIQKKPENLPIVRWGAWVAAAIGVAFIISFLIAR